MFTTTLTDVFALPKLVALWGLLVALSMVLVASIATDEPGPRFVWVGAVDVPLAAFVALLLVALARSTDVRQSLFGEVLQHQGVLTTLLYVGFFVVARVVVRDVVRLRQLLAAVALGGTIVAGYAIVQALGLDPVWDGQLPSGRVFSTIGQANALAAYLVLVIPLATALALGSTGRRRLAELAAVAAMSVALVLTHSRGGYLGLAVAATVLVFGVRDRIALLRRVTPAYAGAALAAVVLVLAVVAPARSTITAGWSGETRIGGRVESVDAHLQLWRVAIEIVERHPLLGTGPETFPDQFAGHAPAVLSPASLAYFERFRVESPHNQVLAIAAGAGIPAAVAYLAVLFGLAWTLWRLADRSADRTERLTLVAVVAAGAGHVVTDSFMTAEVAGSWLFWTIAGGAIGLRPRHGR